MQEVVGQPSFIRSSIHLAFGLVFAILFIFPQAVRAEQKAFKVYSKREAVRVKRLKYPTLPKDVGQKKVVKISKVSAKKNALLSRLWGLKNIGFFDIYKPTLVLKKSGLERCSPGIVVAVVDTGIDYTHPDIKQNLWVNLGETGPWKGPKGNKCHDKRCNGIDDDGNGFIDDIVGWDFVHNVPLPYDTHGHGTHIAGIIASRPAGDRGVVGVCPRVSLMILKYYDANVLGYNNLANTVKAFRYAVSNGAQIINYSGGGNDSASAEKRAILEARKAGVLVVAAAGNSGYNNDRIPYFPASYPLDNIVSVASVDQDNRLLSSSNYGRKSVDVAAPGLSILSNLPKGRAGTMSGTSQATAFVTGAAALLASQYSNRSDFNYRDIRRWLINGTKSPSSGNSLAARIAGGILSLPKALKIQQAEMQQRPTTPPAIATTASK